MSGPPIERAVAFLRARGRKAIGLVGADASQSDVVAAGADGIFDLASFSHNDAPPFDALVVTEGFPLMMRRLTPVMSHDVIVLPADPEWVVPAKLRDADLMQTAWETTADANYVARCALKGHYVEFGTYWGGQFYPAVFRLRHWLKGRFFGFDSFAGLSAPAPDELTFTGGEFCEGAYSCNQASFEALGDYLGAPCDRIVVAPGFYRDSLARGPEAYGLEPGSVSVCVIDCDLREPTEEALAFVTPLLEDGALLFFDDWRLCRASREVGERAAALAWLAEHPEIELVELPTVRTHVASWQHQWFIVQRRS